MDPVSNRSRTKVLVVTPDVLGNKMAGPAIRAFEIAKALHTRVDVTLVSTVGSTLKDPRFPIAHLEDAALRSAVANHDVLVFQGHILSSFPWILETDIIIVADVYDPMQLEILEQGKDLEWDDRIERTINTVEVLNVQLERADFMICASDKQRDLWLGQLGALCRINPHTYDFDPSLRSLIDVVPFGIQDEAPRQARRGIKGTFPGINEDDKVVLWGGGVYNWFDPLTLIRAVHRLAPAHPDLKLFFLGVQHPNPNVPAMRMATETQLLSDELKLTGTHVFFNQEWVDYDQRADYLLDADLGVSTHFDHVETAFSFRTRILDYLWAGLPIVSTAGDTFAELIDKHDLGLVVPPEDVTALANSLETALYDVDARTRFAANVKEFRGTMTWSRTLAPLVEFCVSPSHAADYMQGVVSPRENQRRQLRQRIKELESSTTWRMMAPMRAMSSKLRQR